MLELVREQPVLRQRMALGAIAFGCFSTLWTSLSFLLAGDGGAGGGHYHYGNAAIGLFGLAGMAGALIAPIAGRLADRGHGRLAATATLLILLLSWGLLALGRTSLPALIAGIVVLDLGVQGLHISNQSAVYTLAPEARSRLTTAYMVAYFLGGAVMSAASSALFAASGWDAVCVLGAATAAVGLLVWLLTQRLEPARRVPSRVGPAAERAR